MIKFLLSAGCSRKQAESLSIEIVSNCMVRQKPGTPLPSNKLSFTHVCEAFNNEVQVDFLFYTICSPTYCIMHIVDAGTAYSETALASQRSSEVMIALCETIWTHCHGAQSNFSAESELTKDRMRSFLVSHRMTVKLRPARRHEKTGIVERKYCTIKNILERLQND